MSVMARTRKGNGLQPLGYLWWNLKKSTALKIVLCFFAFAFLSSWCFYYFESRGGNPHYSSYLDALEGIVILIFSGYDVPYMPKTVQGLISAILVMISGVAVFTALIGNVAASLVERKLKATRGTKRMKLRNHILICNWNEHGNSIIDQLLAAETNESREVVIVADLTECPYDNAKVHFVKGNPTKNEVLERAGIDSADTAIILGGEGDAQSSDARAILTALAVESLRPEIYTCVIIFDPENKRHLEHARVDEIICISEMIDRLLVQSSLNHGLSALLSNLLTFTDECEIYKVKVPERYFGQTLMEASLGMLRDEHVTLIGIEIEVPDGCGDARKRIITDPGWPQPLGEGDNAFVIAVSFPHGFENAR